MAATFTPTKGPWARGLAAWMACASTSLPVPVSPSSTPWRRPGRAPRLALHLHGAGEAPMMLENVYFTRRSSARAAARARELALDWSNLRTSGCSEASLSKSMNPAAR